MSGQTSQARRSRSRAVDGDSAHTNKQQIEATGPSVLRSVYMPVSMLSELQLAASRTKRSIQSLIRAGIRRELAALAPKGGKGE